MSVSNGQAPQPDDRYLVGWFDAWQWLLGHRSPALRMAAPAVYDEMKRLDALRRG